MFFDKHRPFGFRRADADSETRNLIRTLEDSNEERRQDAIAALAERGTAILPHLLPAFRDPAKRDLVASAGAVLARWGSEVLPLLAESAAGDDPDTRMSAAGALGYLGREAGPLLVSLLNDPSREVKYRAALALVQVGWTFSPDQVREQVKSAVVRGEPGDLIRIKNSAVPCLLELLDDPDYRMKVGALRALGEIRSGKSLSAIARLFRSDEIEVRSAVIEAFGRIGNEKVIPFLVHALGDPSPYVRIEAVWALEKLGWTPRDPREKVRFLIAKEQWGALAQIEGEAIPALVPALVDVNPNVRNNVTGILLGMGAAAIPSLLAAQKSGREQLRLAAGELLARIQETSGVSAASVPSLPGGSESWVLDDGAIPEDEMLALSSEEPGEEAPPAPPESPEARLKRLSGLLRDPEPAVRLVAVEELRAAGLIALPPLTGALQDRHTGVRSAAAEALGFLKSSRAVPDLIRVLRADPDAGVRASTARALGAIRDAYAIPALADRFPDPDEGVREAAASALGQFGRPALPAVLARTYDRDPRVRSAAYLSLGAMADPGVVTQIVRGFRDPDPGVSAHAGRALDAFARATPQKFLDIVPGLILSGSPGERAGILDTLATVEDERALWIAYGLREDPDPAVRNKAREIIRKQEPATRAGAPDGTLRAEDEPAIRALVRQLSDPRPEAGERAEDQLKKVGPPVIRILIASLRDSPPGAGERIVRILGSMREPAVPDLIGAIHDESPAVREAAVRVLGEAAEERAVYAIGWVLMGEKEPAIREIAAVSLGKTRTKSSIPPLVHGLSDTRAIRRAAIESLGSVGGIDACTALIDFLETAEDDELPPVAEALAVIGPQARAALAGSLAKKGPEFRLNVARVLDILSWQPEDLPGKIRYLAAKGDWEAVSALGLSAIEILVDSLDDDVAENRAEVARVLGQLGEAARGSLVMALSDSRPRVREGAALALGRLGPASGRNLLSLLKDPEAPVRYAAAVSLERIGRIPKAEGPAALYDVARREWTDLLAHRRYALAALVRVLNDRDPEVRDGAIRTMGALGDARAVPYLTRLAEKSGDIRVVIEVIRALGQIPSPEGQQYLLACLAHPVFAVRSQAAFSQEKSGWSPGDIPEKVRFLIALQKPGLLAAMGPAIVPLLVRALQDDQVLGRLVITEALIGMGGAAVAGLGEIARGDDEGLRKEARAMLALLKKREPVELPGGARRDRAAPAGAAENDLPEETKVRLVNVRESLAGADDSAKLRAVPLLEEIGLSATPDLIGLAREETPGVRIAAVRALGRIRSSGAVPVLLPLLSAPDAETRRAAAESLGSIRDPSAIPGLVRGLSDPAAAVRSEAIRALAGMADVAVRSVLEAAEDSRPQVRSAALETLGRFPDPVILHPLVKGLADPDAVVRQTSAKVLGSLVNRPGSPVVDVLSTVLAEGDGPARLSALDALAATDDIRARGLLDLLAHDDDEQIRARAKELIARKEAERLPDSPAGEGRGLPGEQEISGWIRDLGSADPAAREEAMDALNGAGNAAVAPLLGAYSRSDPGGRTLILGVLESMGENISDELGRALGSDDRSVRQSAILALRNVPGRGVPILGHALYAAPDPETRSQIAGALGALRDPRGVKPLIDILATPSRGVILSAIRALGMIGGELAIVPLVRQLESPDEEIAGTAAGVLRQIGEPARAELVTLLRTGSHPRKAIAAGILEEIGSVPRDPVERAYFLIAKERWYDLGEIGEPALSPLRESLSDPSEHIRLGAVTALARIASPGTIPLFVAALSDPSPIVRLRAENALLAGGALAREPLAQALESGGIRFPDTARRILKKIGQMQRPPPPPGGPAAGPAENPKDPEDTGEAGP